MSKNMGQEQVAPDNAERVVADRKSGRAAFDENGRSVWEWQTATGVFERNVSDEQLRRLEAANLTLVESATSEGRVWTSPTSAQGSTGVKAKDATAQPQSKGTSLATLFKRLVRTS